MDDEEFIRQRIEDLKESVRSFSPDRKQEGERWVVNAFLENLRIKFNQDEIKSSDDDPPDVIFRDANFEVKEIMDEGRKRHKEYKEELKRVQTVTDPMDLLKTFRPKVMTVQEVYERCLNYVHSIDKKYDEQTKSSIDLLFYVNLINVTELKEAPYPDVQELTQSGWRSVSFLKGQRSCCLYTSEGAPWFLKDAVGHISYLHPK